ncbi:MAG: alpha/beta fold hydrolase [Chloroflexi bacterium]|nr:alpha/beta fold hydrolase [Chloroflexota bacterium]
MRAKPAALLPGAEAFEFPGHSDLGVVLIHGFTGAPAEMRPVGEYLAQHGVASVGVRLRGHGTHPNDMLGCSYGDWVADVEAVVDDLLTRCERVVLVGLSMGGTLALNVAARHADDPRIAGVVPICAPLVLDDWRLGLVKYVARVVRWQGWGLPDIKDRAGWDRHVGYRRFRLTALAELIALMRETRALLSGVRQPLLVLQATDDHVVPPRNAQLIHDGVSSADRGVMLLDNCYHVVTVDHAADRVSAATLQFVERLAGRPAPLPSV